MTVTIPTPLGPVVAAATDAGVVVCDFADRAGAMAAAATLTAGRPATAGHAHLARLRVELDGYFAGGVTRFTVPLASAAGTPFQRAAWAYLSSIPFGQTWTYGRQAAAMGAPSAVRAVGRANGANRLCIVVPCHRVVGATGDLTGYAGGVDRKRRLLEHERAVAADPTRLPAVLRGRPSPFEGRPLGTAAER